MQAIRSKNTKPELYVRRLLHKIGYRFSLHKKELPGQPDIVFTRRRKVVFIHGCFWHSHADPACKNAARPRTNRDYWDTKLDNTRQRDDRAVNALQEMGWSILILWECELGSEDTLKRQLCSFLGAPRAT